jgi:hypothetical protein
MSDRAYMRGRDPRLACRSRGHSNTPRVPREVPLVAAESNAQLSDGDRERDAQTNPANDPSKAVGESDSTPWPILTVVVIMAED